MQRRSFRASASTDTRYPTLQDVERGPASRWGIITLGGLLLGGPACTPVHAESGSARTATPPSLPQMRPDSGTPPPLPPPGVPVPQRIDPPPPKVPAKTDLPDKTEPPAKSTKDTQDTKNRQDAKGEQDAKPGQKSGQNKPKARTKATPVRPPSHPRVNGGMVRARMDDEPADKGSQ